ncbi:MULTISPECIES: NAD(P)-dependent oxidoreductase [unclassified Streptomyces]|uniref:NAD(P)-dependent oxidoreductase n=1 Tax=unclassified Streptomyces TaxID=2593676 RepID=UPI0022552A3D|nr:MULTISPECIES: NAD(P)-binding domain-containing protein [unclassified Streptomyces]MCX5014084.1 NAD(P)-binding domain-containing protein [Streptomyces sp. NBC_00555]MCX5608101.1 NAD(P)-binding domain-containing protein [Streptomyces sp. NBC_00047]
MTDNTPQNSLTLLGLGDMGTALARTWLAAGHRLTVWNRTAAKAEPLAAQGAVVAATPAEAVAASRLVVVCLLDDSTVGSALDGIDLTGKDLVNLTTGTPAEGRARAAWAEERGARFTDGGIMATPTMIGVPESGGYVFYSGSRDLFDTHRAVLEVPAGARFVGENPGHAALHDVALLSAMWGMFAGISQAYALTEGEDIAPKDLAPLLSEWLGAMGFFVGNAAERLTSRDFTSGVVSNLAMQVTGTGTMLRTAEEQGVSTELISPYVDLLRRRLAADPAAHGAEDTAGAITLLKRP